MNEMLGKLVKLIVKVPADWLETLVDLCEKLASDDGARYLEKIRLVLRKEDVIWEKVKTIYTRLIAPNLPLSDGSAVEVHQLVERATFGIMFRGLEQVPTMLDGLCMSKDQREKFLAEHLNQFPRNSWMLFLHKENSKFLVARACRFSDGGLYRGVVPLSDDDAWYANDDVRLVVPQRTV